MRVRKFLKKWLDRLRLAVLKSDSRGNTYPAAGVSPAALRGRGVQCMAGSLIDPFSEVGSYTYVGHNSYLTRAVVGRYTSIGPNVSIGLGEHPADQITTCMMFTEDAYRVLTARPCVIGNDVWIGVGSVIRRGVTVGDGAVVGANSFVNADVPPFAIVVGSPARVIKHRFPPAAAARISSSRWWDLEPAEARLRMNMLSRDLQSATELPVATAADGSHP